MFVHFFLPSSVFPFFLLQMFFVSLFSVKLSRQRSKCSQSMRAHTHTHTRRKMHGSDVGVRAFSQEMDLILCSQIGGNGWWGEEEEPFAHKDVFPSANYRDRL